MERIQKLLARIPDDVIMREAKRRYIELREARGKYASMKVFRECPKCHQEYSAREMRKHDCKASPQR